jgi:tryptophan-rich sensory protein
MTDLIWSFSPWMTFLFATRFTNLWGGLAAGGLVALIVFVRAVARHKVHMLDVASIAYFTGLAAVLVVLHPGDIDTWGRYAQAGSHGLLTLLVFGSVLIGRPFTESYAREKTPEAAWQTPRFHAFNREISLAWSLAFLVGTISLVLAGAIDHAQLILRLGVPFGALLYAFKYTQQRASQTTTALSATT